VVDLFSEEEDDFPDTS
jgi:hypothetical protein